MPQIRRASGHPLTQGTKLADRIQALGYTMQDVADATGVDRWRINDFLNRRKKPVPTVLRRFADFLECEPETLVD
jgi:transcriptional regulator with XRE-family HTH domain